MLCYQGTILYCIVHVRNNLIDRSCRVHVHVEVVSMTYQVGPYMFIYRNVLYQSQFTWYRYKYRSTDKIWDIT